ncbi:DUF1659 domain-containing protein [Clostridium sp. CCUG 7971]|uniref:DUF1659 domain-containing protein n=1 Tax=Clostridium sp. CCUG 7971 TaxID=2811414 RepID=UPI001ABB1171|nr:DUF1659 domain-containing protein [Clostridium sp. CCUG 7971]MBO3443426.1 DUF1659 domain-containing protein [Clostridium sp. CCUG 7971]
MAVVEIKNPSSLKIRLDLGMVDGKTRTKSYASLKHNTPLQDVYDVAEAIMGLQEHGVLDIIKVDNTILCA